MNKSFTSLLIATSLALSPALKADYAPEDVNAIEAVQEEQIISENTEDNQISTDAMQEPEFATDATQDTTEDVQDTNEGTPVGQASNEGVNAAKKKRWQNIAIAVCAVAIAVTALLLVANNDGHSKSHDHGDK